MQKYSDIPSKLTHKSALRILKYQRLTVEVQKKLESAVVLDKGLAEFKANLRSINVNRTLKLQVNSLETILLTQFCFLFSRNALFTDSWLRRNCSASIL